MLAALMIAAGAASSYAQAGCDDTEKINTLDATIRANYQKNSTLKEAVTAAKEFLEKFGSCEATKEFTDWIKGQMPKWEERLKNYEMSQKMGVLFTKFDDGINNKKYDDVYSAGKEILVVEPKNVHVMIPLGIIALNESYNKNFKYNDDALKYGKMAIDELKSGNAKPKMVKGQVFMNKNGQPAFSTWDFSKEEAIDELTYSLAYINFYTKNDKKTALPLYYELSQSKGRFKDEPRVFGAIGDYYVAEAGKLGAEIASMIEKQKAMATDEEKEKIDVDIKAKVGLFNGYTERAIDAFSRAHKVAPTVSEVDKTYKAGIFKTISELYKRRFDKDAGLNEYMAATLAKPFPNPTSEVTPINDPDPVTNTNTGGVNGSGVGAVSGSGTGTAPTGGMGNVNGSGVGNKATSTATATKPVTPVKKP
jgi:tetratricopeptide (TPR) repeat protein